MHTSGYDVAQFAAGARGSGVVAVGVEGIGIGGLIGSAVVVGGAEPAQLAWSPTARADAVAAAALYA